VQLLHRLSIRSINGSEKLLKVIKVRLPAASLALVTHPSLTEPHHRPPADTLPQDQYVAVDFKLTNEGLMDSPLQPFPSMLPPSDCRSTSPPSQTRTPSSYSSELWLTGAFSSSSCFEVDD
jgi:hypothetical protein